MSTVPDGRGTTEQPGALVFRRRPARPRAAVLFLHGGRENGIETPGPLNLPGLRITPFARTVRRRLDGADVALGYVRYRHRGWNGVAAHPLHDAERALGELTAYAGEVPVALVGHSMGGRAALRAAGHAQVCGVVALAPWCPPGEPVAQLRDRTAVFLHGDRDRVTDPAASVAFAGLARDAGARTGALIVEGGEHTMLRRSALWHELTAECVAGLLGDRELPAPVAESLAQEEPVALDSSVRRIPRGPSAPH